MKRLVLLALASVFAALVLVARLVQIQVREGALWANEAAQLVRSGTLVPYRRGSILDAGGRVLARDRATYRLELSYRDFRREHPLGLVAHARSALEGRPVPLSEALANLEGWTLELAELGPADLAAFERGEELVTATCAVPAVRDPRRELRSQRSSDLFFYVGSLLGFSPKDRARLADLARAAERTPSFLELCAQREGIDPASARAALLDRLERSRRHLELFAERLFLPEEGADFALPIDSLVGLLEHVRNAVEELVAASLFREATGFSAGRVDSETLYRTLDLSWIARPLCWDEARLLRWTEETRRRWLEWRDAYAVPHLLVEFIARGELERDPDRLLALLETIYLEPAALEAALDRETLASPHPAVLGRLPASFGVREASYRVPQDEFAGGVGATRAERWLLLGPLADAVDATDELGRPDPALTFAVGRLRRGLGNPSSLSRYDLELLAHELVPRWERHFQAELARILDEAVAERAAAGTLAPNGRLAPGGERRERALETLRDVVRDYGDRTIAIDPHPTYDLVYLLTRFPEEYAGFRAVDSTVRVRMPLSADADAAQDVLPGAELVGNVSAVGVDALQRQRVDENRLRELRGRTRTREEDMELAELVGEILQRDEWRGVSGIEGEWDDVLRGRNGYREHRGLEDVYGHGRTSSTLSRRVDGEDVRLSIDAGLQRAAEWMLENPEYDASDALVDRSWFAEPVGAIVLLDGEGNVIVSASVPNDFTREDPAAPGERADRGVRMDRTLRKPAFQPPGSVFKPFVAAWALEHLGLDPRVEIECARRGGQPEYGGVRCWTSGGHGFVDLSGAIKVSCNCYFAWLGEQYPGVEDFRDMARAFGFGQPTGLRRGRGRSGLYEEYVPGLFGGRSMDAHESRLAGNGLAVVEATPMQVARAFLALATGELPALANVSEVGGRAPERSAPVPTGMSRETQDFLHRALGRVARETEGTAYRALSPDAVGTRLVAKTGSADLVGRNENGDLTDSGSPKHTWVAGWLPPERPEGVFVVFLDRARATSSHSAVYVAQQFLRLPEVRAWLEGRGVVYQN